MRAGFCANGLSEVLYNYVCHLLLCAMNSSLQTPDLDASTADWKAWADELREMPTTPEVRAARRQADQVLARRKQPKHPVITVRSANAFAFA